MRCIFYNTNINVFYYAYIISFIIIITYFNNFI